eukprot:XP_001708062.1 Hypothetical protein GL50803_14809 [Giardia lamblia ATCC 50803]
MRVLKVPDARTSIIKLLKQVGYLGISARCFIDNGARCGGIEKRIAQLLALIRKITHLLTKSSSLFFAEISQLFESVDLGLEFALCIFILFWACPSVASSHLKSYEIILKIMHSLLKLLHHALRGSKLGLSNGSRSLKFIREVRYFGILANELIMQSSNLLGCTLFGVYKLLGKRLDFSGVFTAARIKLIDLSILLVELFSVEVQLALK